MNSLKLSDYGFSSQNYLLDIKGTYARVTAVHRQRYNLITEHGECSAELKSSVYFNDCTEEFLTTGDFVEIQYNPHSKSLITKTLPRKSKFARSDFSGHAVGKSSLANVLAGKEIMAVNDIRTDDKGKHTTTHRQLILLDSGVIIIDTPGMREIGMWDVAIKVRERQKKKGGKTDEHDI